MGTTKVEVMEIPKNELLIWLCKAAKIPNVVEKNKIKPAK